MGRSITTKKIRVLALIMNELDPFLIFDLWGWGQNGGGGQNQNLKMNEL